MKLIQSQKAEAAVNELVYEMVEELQRRKRLARSEFALQAMLDRRLGGSRFGRDQRDGGDDFELRESED